MRGSPRLRALKRLIAAALVVAAASQALEANASQEPDIETLMRLTVDSWISAQKDGLLPYGFDFLSDKAIEPGRMSVANLIRQTGAAFALARYYEYLQDPRLKQPIAQALTAFGQHSLPIGKGRLQRVIEETRVFSLPVARWKLKTALDRLGLLYQGAGDGKVVSPDGTYGNALAGTVGLTLLTELIYSRASGDESFAALRTAWLDGLLALRIPGGGFRQDASSIDDSDYDNGEAWLALAVYGDMHPNDLRAMKALVDVDEVLMRRYSEEASVYFIGWGGMAAAQRYRTTRDRRFLAYMQGQADAFLARFQERFRESDNNCGAMEGLAAMLVALNDAGESDSGRVRGIRAWLSREVAKLPGLQIHPDQEGLPLGGAAYLRAPRMSQYAGGFLTGRYEPLTRVDAAAHCLSAMVTIERHHLR